MTSGNIAVFDHDARRYLDFVDARRAAARDRSAGRCRRARAEVELSTRAARQPGDVDIPEVQDAQAHDPRDRGGRRARRGAARRAPARFLNLPFYRTGDGAQGPDRPEDIATSWRCSSACSPDIDLRGRRAVRPARHAPHVQGGDRRARSATTAAPHSEVWLYRGAWEEWPTPRSTSLVPLSPGRAASEEAGHLPAPVAEGHARRSPGPDDREFWQRAEDRNLGTAATLDRLGLPEYYAMEAFVVEVLHQGAMVASDTRS